MSSVTLRNLVEEAPAAGVPAITGVEVVANEPMPTLIPVESLRIGPDPAAGRLESRPVVDIPAGELSTATLDGVRRCRECRQSAVGLSPTNAPTRHCRWMKPTGPVHRHAHLPVARVLLRREFGECLTAPGAQLEQVPLRIYDGEIWVRP